MPITEISASEAGQIVALIDGYVEQRQLVRRMFEELSTLLDTSVPDPIPPAALGGLEWLRTKYARIAGETPDFTVPTPLLRAIATRGDGGTTADLADHFGITSEQMQPWLDGLREDGLARELRDGHGNLTWELTALGDREL